MGGSESKLSVEEIRKSSIPASKSPQLRKSKELSPKKSHSPSPRQKIP
jgi:hypothetical protein